MLDQWEALTCSCDLRANEKRIKIFPLTISQSLNQLFNDGGDCRAAPATPGLSQKVKQSHCQDNCPNPGRPRDGVSWEEEQAWHRYETP